MTNRTPDPARCEYCLGERYQAPDEPCQACNRNGGLMAWEDHEEPEVNHLIDLDHRVSSGGDYDREED